MHRRFLYGCLLSFLLASCARESDLPPEDVLRRAALASSALQSARFTADASFQAMPSATLDLDLTFKLQGVVQQGGQAAQFSASVDGNVQQNDVHHRLTGAADVAADWGRDVYVKLGTIELVPGDPTLPLDALRQFAGSWWRIPQGTRSASALAPDPGILQAQSQVVRITRDRGIQRIHGNEAYRYDVTIDPEKLIAFLQKVSASKNQPFDPAAAMGELSRYQASGELWIDTKTYYVERVAWTIRPAPGAPADTMGLTLHADLTDHDKAPAVQFPPDAKYLPWMGNAGGLLTGTAAVLPPASVPPSDRSVLEMLQEQQDSSFPGEIDPVQLFQEHIASSSSAASVHP